MIKRYLDDEDQRVIIELFHEAEHNGRHCIYSTQGRPTECSQYHRGLEHAERGAFTIINSLIASKVAVALQEAGADW